ncbi:mechanosensitive ion channel family protein [Thiorhodococcus minor]|uniref:Small-conductance mechanosensitive channel n=1 Tax=Thiorhodococcus minor TaxID=57489 RepID=A0A6M0K636_9GAMM|nr:mechanosensitive ion channel family protein [Thiorhodococcus minor]NEV64403.1 mechanosensitive ion channel family protein [Thiorhodococcus minor]
MRTEEPACRRHFQRSIAVALGVLLSIACFAVAADEATAVKATERITTSNEPVELADVVVDGLLVTTVRGSASFPAARRALEIKQSIIEAAQDERIPADAVTIEAAEDRTLLLAGERLLLEIFDADAEIEGLSRELLAEDRQRRIQEVMAAYRAERRPEVLLKKTAYAVAAVLFAAVLIFAFARASRALAKLLDRRLQEQIKTLEQKSARLIRSRNLAALLRTLTKIAFFALVALTLYLSTQYVLGLFPWTRESADWLFGLILTPLQEIGLGLLGVIPNLIRLAILFFITRYLLRTVSAFFHGIDNGSIKLASLDRELALPTYRLVRLVIILFAIVMAYPYIPGSDSAAFKGLSVLAGLIISLGSQSIIGNIIAGYSLLYRRPFKIGDRIKIGDTVGNVTELRVLTTRLRSLKNEEVVIPNTTVLNGEVVNYSTRAREQGLILHTTVGIGYETPWRQVEAMLKEAAGRTSGLLERPKPFVLQQALGDFAITYEINAHCNDANNMAQIYSALHRNILDVFNEYGVAIMTPSYIADPPEPKLVPKGQWYAPPAAPPREQAESK